MASVALCSMAPSPDAGICHPSLLGAPLPSLCSGPAGLQALPRAHLAAPSRDAHWLLLALRSLLHVTASLMHVEFCFLRGACLATVLKMTTQPPPLPTPAAPRSPAFGHVASCSLSGICVLLIMGVIISPPRLQTSQGKPSLLLLPGFPSAASSAWHAVCPKAGDPGAAGVGRGGAWVVIFNTVAQAGPSEHGCHHGTQP